MKYLVTESQIDRVIFKYLDIQDFVLYDDKRKFNNYIYFLNNITDDTAQISVYLTNSLGDVRNWVYVNGELIQRLSGFFSIDEDECLETIERWVSNVLNKEVGRIENTDNTGAHYRLYKNK
ncbi:hypothetical protein UFOVP117_254 [uncultured Caudovirales phage]|uniref:Uncharacterized protein n=1 Tax=uncultured Caudovirales phage TaxID=2100421 RepID=A0A6J5L5U7_9CAUD|nr:hypothetical protein UFOVP117_254 [uncultured Caudovirales phage]